MKKTFKKAVAVLTVLCMIMTFVPEAFATTTVVGLSKMKITSSYKNSTYYTKALNAYNNAVKNNLSDADRFVNVALSQVGYKASMTAGDYNGDGNGLITKNHKTYNEYSKFMGVNGEPWCASFVSWAAAAANISNDVVSPGPRCGHWRSGTKAGSKFIKIWSSDFKTYYDYKPQVGDLVLYTGTCGTCGKYANSFKSTSHIGIVVSVDKDRASDGGWKFTTVERVSIDKSTKAISQKLDYVNKKTFTTKQTRGTIVEACKCNGSKLSQVKLVQGFFHPNWADGRKATADTIADIVNETINGADSINSGNTNTGSTNSGNTNTGSTNSGSTNTGSTATAGTIDHSGTNYISTSKGSVAWPTNTTYLAKQKIGTTNATLVANIKKTSGSHLNYTAIVLYDSKWNALADKQFSNTNVSDSTTNFHVWFDLNKEVGITLKPGQKYYYRIYAKVDGEKIASPHWNFTTGTN